jgi:hypothetical protein
MLFFINKLAAPKTSRSSESCICVWTSIQSLAHNAKLKCKNSWQLSLPIFVDVQNELLDTLNTRLVIPLISVGLLEKKAPSYLCPVIHIDEGDFVILTHQMAPSTIAHTTRHHTPHDHLNLTLVEVSR